MALDEQSYSRGYATACTSILSSLVGKLGIENPEAAKAAWIVEREDVITLLRSTCESFGDNDWPDNLHLGDILRKHLICYFPDEDDDREDEIIDAN